MEQIPISTHVPRAGDDPYYLTQNVQNLEFQPTSPVRETTNNILLALFVLDISTHVPRAGDDEKEGTI